VPTPVTPISTPADANYLIVSDLHLRGGFNNPTEGLYHFDAEFADFLRYYRLHRTSTRPWTLIIGGDFVEFRYVTDLPEPGDPLLRGVTFSKAEARFGAGSEADKSRWKLDRILRSSHPQLLLSLARFIAEGNHVVVLRGNHDTEMIWPEVQEHFRRLIAEHHPADVGYMAMKEAVAQRLQFAPWFWYVPEVLYVEHGCQYDPFCAFEYFLNPVVPTRPTRIENSISDLSIRYFANQMKLLDAMAVENIRSASEYFAWVMRGNLALIPRAVRLYAGMVRRIVAKSGRPDPDAERRVRAEHERRLADADARLGLPPGSTAAVHALHATPVMRSVSLALRFLGIDLFALGGLLLVLLAVLPVAYPHSIGLPAVGGAALVGAVLVFVGMRRARRILDYENLRRIADRIAQRFDVPYVIFGHSHQAGRWPLSNGGTYFNVGTWVPLAKNAYFVYFAVTGEGAERAGRLWRWNKAAARPDEFG
jgi:UDP-2,3-diacylglucosamine pyrophosphatase LpxH